MAGGNFILLPEYYIAEYEAAKFIAELAKRGCDKLQPVTDGLKHRQPETVENACTHPISILTGPPGTGKTTTLKCIIDSYLKAGLQGAIFTPTGKAAKRADEVVNAGRNFINKISCSTIQSGLKFDFKLGGYSYHRTHRLEYDFLIFDEYSMVDAISFRDAMEAVPANCRVVLCGDQYQLPSVGPGSVARDTFDSGCIPAVELDTVLRTGANSGITYNANRILRGQEVSKIDDSGTLFTDFFLVPRESEEKTLETILDYVAEKIPTKLKLDPLKDIQVMAPAKNGDVGVKILNERLRAILNPDKKQPYYGGFRVGDKVVNNKNDKKLQVVNGDTGIIKDIHSSKTETTIEIDFGPGAGVNQDGIVRMTSEQFSKVSLAYCTTVHKGQGSEFPVAIIPIHQCHVYTLTRQLIYTGLTRSRQLGLFIGDNRTLKTAIANVGSLRRKTALKGMLKAEFKRLGMTA